MYEDTDRSDYIAITLYCTNDRSFVDDTSPTFSLTALMLVSIAALAANISFIDFDRASKRRVE